MDIEDLLDQLDDAEQSSPKFGKLLGAIEGFAQGGDLVAAEAIAEVFGSSKLHFDAGKSYFWYHVVLARQGYKTQFANRHDNFAQYLGVVGDFRNESQVSDLLPLLGEERVHELDRAAREWLEKHPNA